MFASNALIARDPVSPITSYPKCIVASFLMPVEPELKIVGTTVALYEVALIAILDLTTDIIVHASETDRGNDGFANEPPTVPPTTLETYLDWNPEVGGFFLPP